MAASMGGWAATFGEKGNKLAGEAGLVPGGWSKTVWTRRVKEALVELGLKESYKSCASEVSNATWVEWLYDVVWLDKNEIGLIGAIPLVGEIEWGNERAVWDGFQKLLGPRGGPGDDIRGEGPGAEELARETD